MLNRRAVILNRVHRAVIGGTLGATIFLWFSQAPAEVPENLTSQAKYRAPSCDHFLSATARITSKVRAINTFARYSIEDMSSGGGFLLRLNGGGLTIPTVDLPVEETKALWHMQDWEIDDNRFQFLDSGFHTLATESNLINHSILAYADKYPDANLRIRFSPEHESARLNLHYLRWRMHDAVLRKYVERKRYLRGIDFAQLTWANNWSHNTDAFGLLTGEPKPAEDMTWDELYERLALTMQITYYGRRDFFRPSLRGGLHALRLEEYSDQDMLPFEFRLSSDHREQIVNTVYARFRRETTCELTRYARFSEIPRETHDLFLLRILERLEGRGMRTILASVDHITAALFGKLYGFRVLMEIPTNEADEQEYISYLEVGTPQYEELKAQLKKSSRAVQVTR